MAKRRLSQQQKRRIHQAQKSTDLDNKNNHQGLVISHHGGEVEVKPSDPDRDHIHCKFRANLGGIVCGDQVIFRQNREAPSIVAILPRKNSLQRQDGFGQNKTIAANVSQLLVCLSVEPEPNLFLLDQYLLSAEQQQIQPLIIFNKIDLLTNGNTDPFGLHEIYTPLGYEILPTSIIEKTNIDLLQQHCKDHVNVISGVSGVGKSSLTKTILPELEILIREISVSNKEGRHTTRTSRLYHLPLGGSLIDTPGVRGFNPVFDNEQSIAVGFREIDQQAQHCHFSNCKHIKEPKCAVIDAVKSSLINPGRYENYLKLMQSG